MNTDTDDLTAAPAPAMPPPHSVQPAAGVGSEAAPAWKILCVDDEPNIVAALRRLFRGSGYEVGQPVRLSVRNKKTGVSLKDPEGRPLEKTVTLPPDGTALEEEFLVKPDAEGQLVVDVVADLQPGELTADDNSRDDTISVLNAKINVLYVEGYPRWEYRYIKNEMIRDSTVNISCLLTSADSGFAQEGDDPIPDFLFVCGADSRHRCSVKNACSRTIPLCSVGTQHLSH